MCGMYMFCIVHVYKYSVFIKKNIYAEYIIRRVCLNICNLYSYTYIVYKNDVCETHNFSAKYMYVYNIYVKYIQDIFSPIF